VDNYQVILDYFAKVQEPINAGKVAADTSIDRKEVDKIMNKLKKEGKISSPKRCYWEINK
jgi:DNA-binding IscR family transcriptional regulator